MAQIPVKAHAPIKDGILRFSVDGRAKMIHTKNARCDADVFCFKKDENFSVFKQKADVCGKGLNGLCKIKFLTLV